MFTLPKRPLYVLSNKVRRRLTRHRPPVERMKEKWIADFSKPEKSCFIIKPEIAYNAYLEKEVSSRKGALFLGLKKKNCMAWLETAHRVYMDHVIEAHFRFDDLGGYCAAGIMFRVAEPETYYLALVSSKGYFRLDAVTNNVPRPLVGWTETPGLQGDAITLGIIAKGDHFIVLINGKWAAETHDAAIPGGHLGFALVSYDTDLTGGYMCQARLHFLSVDSCAGAVEAEYLKWHDNAEISAESRFRLAESLAALDYFDAAYYQILRAWKQREESAKSVTATYTEMRTRGELLFAAQMASRAGEYAAAEEYIEAYLVMGIIDTDEINVIAEKAQILSAQNKHEELATFLTGCVKKYADIPSLYALLGHARWNLKQYKEAAAAWNKAYRLDRNNGLYEELKKKAEKKIK
jgi:hypothetical protein